MVKQSMYKTGQVWCYGSGKRLTRYCVGLGKSEAASQSRELSGLLYPYVDVLVE